MPKTEIALGKQHLPLVHEPQEEELGHRELDWIQTAKTGSQQKLVVTISVKPVTGIVITQDCDAIHSDAIALCEIVPFNKLFGIDNNTKPTKYVRIVPAQAMKNQKWFYLPPDPALMGFPERMAVDFRLVFAVPRLMLEKHSEILRLGRLNDEVACPHFRERVSQFFRRYPLNEWYPFSSEEMDLYEADKGYSVERYWWQQ